RELEQLLDWKRRELRDLETGEGRAKQGQALKDVADEIATVKEQVDGLETHLKNREQVLEDLKRQVEEQKSAR
ncbi:endocytosis defective- protein, partial [Cryomyces antarcticus]